MKIGITITFILSVNFLFAQKSNWIKLNAAQILHPGVGLTYEVEHESNGYEFDFYYTWRNDFIIQFNTGNFDPISGNPSDFFRISDEQFFEDFLEMSFSYTKNKKLFKSIDGYIGGFINAQFNISRQEGFEETHLEIKGLEADEFKSFDTLGIGWLVGVTTKFFKQKISLDFGFGSGINLLSLGPQFRESTFIADIQIGFRL